MQTIKNILKKIVPEKYFAPYFYLKAVFWSIVYRFPAKKMIVIGVTGTKGKTSTSNYIWSVLNKAKIPTGIITTANFRIMDTEVENPHHMTMPSAKIIQEKLHEMLSCGVKVAIVEMTSEGMKQSRHIGIPVDIAVFTNLTPEHLGSHNNDFSIYKKAKSKLFTSLIKKPKNGILPCLIESTIIANKDSEHSDYYLQFDSKNKITYGVLTGEIKASAIIEEMSGTRFVVGGHKYSLTIPGLFNVYNALPAIIIGQIFNIDHDEIEKGLHQMHVIPGRMESIEQGQKVKIFVDYAHEPASIEALLDSAKNIKSESGRILLLTGVIGGGRASRIPLIEIATKKADVIMITNEDPYDDDPAHMIELLSNHAIKHGKKLGESLFTEIDRKKAIDKLVSMAEENDIVLISGKGAETTMMTKDGAIPFDERKIVNEIAKKYS